MEENVLRNGTAYTILAIGEEATDETRLSTLISRIAGILRLGKYNEPFPYMNERIMAALRTSGPLAIQNGNAYVLTEKGLRLYYAIIDALYDAKGREVVRKVLEVRKVNKKRKRTKALEKDAVVPQ